MVEVQMGEEHIGDVIAGEAELLQGTFQRVGSVQVVVPEELRILLVADAIVDQGEAIAVLHQQAAHGPGAQVVGIGRVFGAPQRFGDHPEHGTAIQLEEPRVDRVQLHGTNIGRAFNPALRSGFQQTGRGNSERVDGSGSARLRNFAPLA